LATYHAVAATSQAILNLLANACPVPEFAGIRFELYESRNFLSPMEEGLSLYLYRIVPSETRRNLPPRTAADGRRYRAPVPVDLHYLLTAWAKDAVKQQRILGWALRALEDAPILPSGLLNQPGPEPDTFRPEETVEVVLESLSIADLNYIWEVARDRQQPSIAVAARMVTLESTQTLEDAPPVSTRIFGAGKVVEP
jgi:hypothetical protein